MRHIALILLTFMLAVAPAGAKEEICTDLPAWSLETDHRNLAMHLLAEPQPRHAPHQEAEVVLRAEDDFFLLDLSPSRTFSPWLGAGVGFDDLGNAVKASEIRLGLGLGCRLGEGLRLNLDWRYSTDGGRELSNWVEDSPESEQHRLSVGFKKNF